MERIRAAGTTRARGRMMGHAAHQLIHMTKNMNEYAATTVVIMMTPVHSLAPE